MPLLIVSAALIVGAAFGAAKHDGLLKKGSDTTVRDTIDFEEQAAHNSLEYIAKLRREKNLPTENGQAPGTAPTEPTGKGEFSPS